MTAQQGDVAAREQREQQKQRKQRKQRKQQKQQVFHTGTKFGDYTKFAVCRKFKLDRKNFNHDRTKKFDCMIFQCDCIEIDLDTKSELSRMKRHFDCTKFYVDEFDCMNAETCRNSEFDCLIFETCKSFEFELEFDRMKSDSEMKSV